MPEVLTDIELSLIVILVPTTKLMHGVRFFPVIIKNFLVSSNHGFLPQRTFF